MRVYADSLCYCGDTSGYHGQLGHVYLNLKRPFAENDPCVFGCGCKIGWMVTQAADGIEPYQGCPKRVELAANE